VFTICQFYSVLSP